MEIIDLLKLKWGYYQANSKNHMKMPKFAIIVKIKFKINMLEIKKYCTVRDHCHYTGKYRATA